MKKIAIMGLVVIAAGQPFAARAGNGGAIAAGIIGGLALGAIAASAAHQHPRYYYYAPRRRVHRAASRPVAAPPARFGEITVSRDDPSIVRYFFDCRYRRVTAVAQARYGFIRPKPSTRFVCNDPNFPVTEFEYAPSPASGSFDEIVFRDRGRVIYTQRVTLDASLHVRPPDTRVVAVRPREEKVLWKAWNCTGEEPRVSALARSGFVNVRDATASVCGATSYPVKEVVYRALDNFSGTDVVMIRGNMEPVDLPLQVLKQSGTTSIEPPLHTSTASSPPETARMSTE